MSSEFMLLFKDDNWRAANLNAIRQQITGLETFSECREDIPVSIGWYGTQTFGKLEPRRATVPGKGPHPPGNHRPSAQHRSRSFRSLRLDQGTHRPLHRRRRWRAVRLVTANRLPGS